MMTAHANAKQAFRRAAHPRSTVPRGPGSSPFYTRGRRVVRGRAEAKPRSAEERLVPANTKFRISQRNALWQECQPGKLVPRAVPSPTDKAAARSVQGQEPVSAGRDLAFAKLFLLCFYLPPTMVQADT